MIKRKVGRPKININWKQFDNLCALQCTLTEISNFFGYSEDTIERRCKEKYKKNFAEVFKQKRTKGFISLRRSQFKLAENNVAMAIFLGKNYLGQKDKQEVSHNIDLAKFGEMISENYTEDE